MKSGTRNSKSQSKKKRKENDKDKEKRKRKLSKSKCKISKAKLSIIPTKKDYKPNLINSLPQFNRSIRKRKFQKYQPSPKFPPLKQVACCHILSSLPFLFHSPCHPLKAITITTILRRKRKARMIRLPQQRGLGKKIMVKLYLKKRQSLIRVFISSQVDS